MFKCLLFGGIAYPNWGPNCDARTRRLAVCMRNGASTDSRQKGILSLVLIIGISVSRVKVKPLLPAVFRENERLFKSRFLQVIIKVGVLTRWGSM